MTGGDGLGVLEPGPFATVQDLGRHGYKRFGVSPSGAVDPTCLRLANSLVGNPETEAGIEFTLSGGIYECMAESCRVAVTGARVSLKIDGVPGECYRAYRLARGSRLALGAAREGLRGYLAIEGGFDLPEVLGSRSTHVRSAIGGLQGRELKAGDILPLCRAAASESPLLALPPEYRPALTGNVRLVLGPQDDLFSEAARSQLLTGDYVVDPDSDRMACRLDGPAISHEGDFNIVSDGTVNGSIQVTGGGTPIVLLADRQTTGGYPKIATVIGLDVRLVAQCQPGQAVRFQAVSLEEAEAAVIGQDEIDIGRRRRIEEASLPPDMASAALLSKNLISGVVGKF